METVKQDKLSYIQSKLKAPKSLYNEFGAFKYRSLEMILASLKPLLAETGCHLIFKDAIDMIGNRYYVRAEAYLFDGDKLIAMTQAYAREPENRKKMDDAMVTGSSSTYARKYCAAALFLIDDNPDPDAMPLPEDEAPAKKPDESIELLKKANLLQARNFKGDLRNKIIETINDPKFASISGQQALAARIKEQLAQQVENLPPPPPRPSAKTAHFTLPPDAPAPAKDDDKKPEDYF